MLSNMMNAVIRTDGNPAGSMVSMLAGAVVNIILDPIFIFGINWESTGMTAMTSAALATVIGQLVLFIISVIYFSKTKTFKLKLKSFIPNLKAFASALKLGISSFITQITIVIISLVCNIMLATYGAQSQYGLIFPLILSVSKAKCLL
jgi:Na+-driven multidrug efflux pump